MGQKCRVLKGAATRGFLGTTFVESRQRWISVLVLASLQKLMNFKVHKAVQMLSMSTH